MAIPPLVHGEEQELLRESARGFLDEHCPVAELRRVRDDVDPDGFARPVWKEMAELGWAGIPFDEALGGAGLGWTELGVVLHECGRTLAPTPLFASVAVGGALIDAAGSDDQKREWLAPLCAGDLLLAGAVQEGAHHAPHRVATRAERDGDGFVLTGEKHFVIDGHVADRIVVVARTEGADDARDGLGLFVVDPTAEGVTTERLRMLDGRNAANLRLDGVRVDASAVLGEPGDGGDALDRVCTIAAVATAAEMLGGIEAAFERTLAYLKVREQFGVPIGSFQALKHRAAKMYIELELTKTAVLEALLARDVGDEQADLLASVAKAKAGDAAQRIGDEGVQMHGGIGVTDEEDIGLFLKRFRVQQRQFGDARFHRDRFATLSGY